MRIASKCVSGWMAVAALLCAPVICGQEVGAPATPPKPKTVEITPTNIQAHVGDKIKFTAVAKDDAGKIHSRRDMGVFFIPMTGAMMKLPPPAHGAPAPPPAAITEVKTTTE